MEKTLDELLANPILKGQPEYEEYLTALAKAAYEELREVMVDKTKGGKSN